jgi:RNA polymerase sigma-70 factor (ECF subfamily)
MQLGIVATHKQKKRPWTGLTDEDLASCYRSAAGESERQDAFAELFDRYFQRVARWCLRFTHDRESAFDLAQEVFLRAHRGLHGFRGGSRFSTWIYVVARNHCRSALERRAGEPPRVAQDDAMNIADPHSAQAYLALETSEICAARCRDILQALTALEARIVMLHYGHEKPLAEISRELGLTNKSGAKAYIVSARRKLTGVIQRHRQTRAVA